jgi:hypothetical protein
MLICPACGFKPEPKCSIVAKDGELVEFSARNAPKPRINLECIEFYRQLKHFAASRGYKHGWVAHK